MDSEKQTVNIGLDFDAQAYSEFLRVETLSAYRKGYAGGYAAGQKAEMEKQAEKRRIFWAKVRKGAWEFCCVVLSGFVIALIFVWVTR